MLNRNSLSECLFARRAVIFAVVFLLVLLCVPMTALAQGAQGGTVPWETGLQKLIDVLSGKTALLISMVGLFFAGGMLIFGGQLSSFGRSVMMVVLVGSMLAALANVANLFITAEGFLLL